MDEQNAATLGRWERVAESDDIPPGEMIAWEGDERKVAIYNVDGALYATDNVCTHAFALLTDGWLEDDVVECPLHGGRFNVCTGKALGPPVYHDLSTVPVRVVDGTVEIFVAAPSE
jgi:nitrite reductase/ring-hydroxylating ferredoxin subunit